jgi:hypothetical protein
MIKNRRFEKAGVLTAFLLVFFVFTSVEAQSPIQVTQNQLDISLPDKAVFSIAAESQADLQLVTLSYQVRQLTCQELTVRRPLEFQPADRVTLDWEMDFQRDGALIPGQDVTWQWEIRDAAGNFLTTEPLTITIQDQRHSWQSASLGPVQVQWYQGNRSFGQRIAETAFRGLERLQDDLGVVYEQPIRITVYPDTGELRNILVESVEWVGAVAYPKHGLILMAATTDDSGWIEEVLPHELSHLVLYALMFNCQGGTVPTWLGEGLAEHTQGQIPQEEAGEVLAALEDDRLPPLDTLEGSFSHYGDEAGLSYSQSHMVVTYLVETYGPEKVADLLAMLRSGLESDKAMQAVYGFDTAGLDREWRESLGFKMAEPSVAEATPTRTGIPTLALWTPVVQVSPTSQPTAVASVTPLPPPTALATPIALAQTQASEVPATLTEPPAAEPTQNTGPCGSALLIYLPLALLGARWLNNRLQL